jgi:rod shape-determining protein MreD
MITLFLALATVLAVLLQVSLPFGYLPLDLAFLVCVFTGLQRGRGAGLMMGALGGLLLDALVSPRLGPRLVSLALSGAIADSLSSVVNREQPRLQALAAAALSLLHDGLLYGCAALMDLGQGGPRRFLLDYALPRLALHGLLAVPFFFVFRAMVRARVFQDPLSRKPSVIRKLPR